MKPYWYTTIYTFVGMFTALSVDWQAAEWRLYWRVMLIGWCLAWVFIYIGKLFEDRRGA
jgi:hypothetical protein